MIELRFKKLFLSFGTLQGNAIKSSDFYSYLCEIFVGKLDGELWANKTQHFGGTLACSKPRGSLDTQPGYFQ
jgi:hypothetical protein